MSISIESEKCIGCGKCTEACPGNLLLLENNKAEIRDIRDCWGCTACVKTCPCDAIGFAGQIMSSVAFRDRLKAAA